MKMFLQNPCCDYFGNSFRFKTKRLIIATIVFFQNEKFVLKSKMTFEFKAKKLSF